jgi:alpha-mannosidase
MNNYGTDLTAKNLVSAARRYREKDRSTIQAVLFGYGDGGGGPNAGMLERLRRYRNLEGVPKLIPMSPHDFFRQLEQESHNFPVWVGELYLEFHRGTYTTQALNKRFNRKAEITLHNLELLSAIAQIMGEKMDISSELNSVWKLVLLNQFHDILPGSSIDEVYRDSHAQYQQVFKITERLLNSTIRRLCSRINTSGDGIPVAVFNTLSWDRNSCVTVQLPKNVRNKKLIAVAPDKTAVPVQRGYDGFYRFIAGIPSAGYKVFHIKTGEVSSIPITADSRKMENEHVLVNFDAAGRIKQIYDKTSDREIIPQNAIANQFLLYEDKTVTRGEAWDIDLFYMDKLLEADGKLLSFRVVEAGPVRGVVQIKRTISKSTIIQNIILYKNIKRIDFETEIHWGPEKDVLLKVAFPLNIRSNTARYEIQFGNVERPTHQNTLRDLAMFEVPAHKWADLSEPDYGVALLNDCKYGYDIRRNVIRLTLLRAPRYPAKTADVNRIHKVTYSIFPHKGNFTNGVVRMAYDLNIPLIAHIPTRTQKGLMSSSESWFSLSSEHVIIETIKKAENDDSIIVRLYEAHGCHATCTLKTSLPIKHAIETNLLEQEERKIPVRERKITLEFSPFQIRTLKLTL